MTRRFGEVIGEHLQRGDVVALVGELGTGKTCLTAGIALGLRVPEVYPITSPTFTLINEYPGRLPLYHLDVYRLSGTLDLEEMGYEEYFYGDGVVVIEWAEKIKDLLPPCTLLVEFTYIDDNNRRLVITGEAGKVAKIAKALGNGG